MRTYNYGHLIISILLTVVVGTAAITAAGQKMTINAIAHGTSGQLGKLVNVDIYIDEFSAPEERAVLIEAFMSNGSEGLSNALDKMSGKGRIAVTGTIGYDLNYIRSFNEPDGTQVIQFVTDRPLRFEEVWAMARSCDYNITVGEIRIPKDEKNITGKLLPAVLPKLKKSGEIELEAYQWPWELGNVRIHRK